MTHSPERLREADAKVMNWTVHQLTDYICTLECRVEGQELAAQLRPDDRAREFSFRRGALVGDNIWEFVLCWAEGAEKAIKTIDKGVTLK